MRSWGENPPDTSCRPLPNPSSPGEWNFLENKKLFANVGRRLEAVQNRSIYVSVEEDVRPSHIVPGHEFRDLPHSYVGTNVRSPSPVMAAPLTRIFNRSVFRQRKIDRSNQLQRNPVASRITSQPTRTTSVSLFTTAKIPTGYSGKTL